jgi:hypothetical protein
MNTTDTSERGLERLGRTALPSHSCAPEKREEVSI